MVFRTLPRNALECKLSRYEEGALEMMPTPTILDRQGTQSKTMKKRAWAISLGESFGENSTLLGSVQNSQTAEELLILSDEIFR